MSRLNHIATFSSFVAFAGAVLFGLLWRPHGPVELQLIKIEPGRNPDLKVATVEFRKRGTNSVYFAPHLEIQTRVGNLWLQPEKFPESDTPALFWRTNRELVEFFIPRVATACRIHLDYRIGRRPYCRAYFFLQQHGLQTKFPRLCKIVLSYFRRHDGWKHVEPELVLPSQHEFAHLKNPTPAETAIFAKSGG